MPSYQPIPDVPATGLPQWQYQLLNSMKENIEILMGVRQAARAVTSDTIQVAPGSFQTQTRLSAQGVQGTVTYADYADYVKLCQDVQTVLNDLGRIQSALNDLLNQLRS